MAKNQPSLPSKEDVLAFVAAQPHAVGTREIARAFGLKNAARAALKEILRDLKEENKLASGRRKLQPVNTLPSTLVAEITGRDRDGELLATPSEWPNQEEGQAPRIRVLAPRRGRAGSLPGVGDRVLLRIADPRLGEAGVHEGRLLRLLDRAPERVVGVFHQLPDGSGRVSPVDKKGAGREILVSPSSAGKAEDGELVCVEVQRRAARAPARVVERLGSLKSERAVSLIAIRAHGLPDAFSDEALQEAEAATAPSPADREDWRDLPLVTIDPADAKDHDDAVHARPDPDPANEGGFILSVAIADVAYYVRPGSALDREALARGNSVYFPDRVVPMLPERISNDLCSLRPEEDRAALAVRMIIDRHGRKRAHSFHRVLMRSRARLHYGQVQAAAERRLDDVTRSLWDPVLDPLYAAYRALKSARDAREPLDLDVPERKILLKGDGTVERVIVPERLDSHRLIEEFMILANVAAAETLEKARSPLIYRVHDEPALEKMEPLREFLATFDIRLPKGIVLKPASFNRILERARGRDHEKLINEVVLRSQAQAEYSAENYGHFGLALRRYAHFTSPIRRYADLMVHRALISALKLGPGGFPPEHGVEELSDIAARISAAERRAMRAERETADRLVAQFLADRVGATFDGHISGVTRSGLFVKLDETGADGFVPAATLGHDYFRYEEAKHALIGRASGETHRLGDRVSVRLLEATPLTGGLRFELLANDSHMASTRFGGSRRRKPVKRVQNRSTAKRKFARRQS